MAVADDDLVQHAHLLRLEGAIARVAIARWRTLHVVGDVVTDKAHLPRDFQRLVNDGMNRRDRRWLVAIIMHPGVKPLDTWRVYFVQRQSSQHRLDVVAGDAAVAFPGRDRQVRLHVVGKPLVKPLSVGIASAGDQLATRSGRDRGLDLLVELFARASVECQAAPIGQRDAMAIVLAEAVRRSFPLTAATHQTKPCFVWRIARRSRTPSSASQSGPTIRLKRIEPSALCARNSSLILCGQLGHGVQWACSAAARARVSASCASSKQGRAVAGPTSDTWSITSCEVRASPLRPGYTRNCRSAPVPDTAVNPNPAARPDPAGPQVREFW